MQGWVPKTHLINSLPHLINLISMSSPIYIFQIILARTQLRPQVHASGPRKPSLSQVETNNN